MRIITYCIAIIIFFSLIISGLSSFSQDMMILNDNRVIIAKNIVITPENIKYQLFENPDEKDFFIPRRDVRSIYYKDGTMIELNSKNHTFNKLNLSNNLISFHFLDFVISNFTFSYEKILAGGKYGIQIPVSLGYKDKTTTVYYPIPTEPDYTNKLVSKFYTGVNLNIYPTGQGRIKYFLGPGLRIGSGLYFNNPNSYNSNSQDPLTTGYFKFLLNNGLVYSPVNSFCISAIGSIGIQYMLKKEIKKAQTTGALAINLSLRF